MTPRQRCRTCTGGHGGLVNITRVVCPTCRAGDAQDRCRTCKRTGWVPCPDCDGKGYLPAKDDTGPVVIDVWKGRRQPPAKPKRKRRGFLGW